ncbi:MAG: Trk system potassium transporter TrkA [Myxococcales bacterium]|nr:Trk system potassium transporter TrkA [Myxococcales bacterium]
MQVVIAGEDIVGYRIAEELMHGHDVTFVGPVEPAGTRLDQLDVQVVHGAITAPEVLRQARMGSCDVFVACTDSDESNLVACVAAQGLGAKRTICMLSSPGFLSVADDDVALAEALGIHSVVRPSEQLAEEILRIVTVPGALDVQEFADGRVKLLRYAVEAGAPITRKRLRYLSLPRHVQLIMLRRGDEMIVPQGDTLLQAGDKVTAMGRWTSLRRLLLKFLRKETTSAEPRTAAVVGGGTVGFAVTRGLEEAGWHVKLIEIQRARCEEIAGQLESLVLYGDGADLDLLQQEAIDQVSVLVAVANNDEKNLLVSLLAKQLGVKRTVTRAERLSNELMFEKVGVDVVRSAKGAAIRSVVRSIDQGNLEIQAELEHGDACVIELRLPADYRAVLLSELAPPAFARVGSILRDRKLIIPSGEDELRPGDEILVICTRADEAQTRDYFLMPHPAGAVAS